MEPRRDFQPGDPSPGTRWWNSLLRHAKRTRLARVGTGLQILGGALARLRSPRIWAKLSGGGPSYGFAETTPNAAGGFDLVPGGRTDAGGEQPAYEANSVTGLANTYQRLRFSAVGDWRFQDVRLDGSSPCILHVTSTEVGYCDSDTDFGVWTTGFSIGVPTPTIVVKNSAGTTVTNPSTQPVGTYSATSTVPTSLCASVPNTSAGFGTYPVPACITYAGPVTTTGITHNCPSDPTHNIPAPAFTGWQVEITAGSIGVSNDAGCGSQTGPTGTGTTSDGQTFAIPGNTLLNSDGTSLTISGTYTLTGTMCCNTDGPGTPLFTDSYTINGTFSFPFCQGPCQIMTFSVGCYQPTIEEGGDVYLTSSLITGYCTPTGTTVTGSINFGDLGNPPYESLVSPMALGNRTQLPPFPPFKYSDGKIRVGFVSPCLVNGGAETWMATLAKSLDERFVVVGVAVNGPGIDPDALNAYRDIYPVSEGAQAVRTLANNVDILIVWGDHSFASQWRNNPNKPFLLSACHITPEWDHGLYADVTDIDGFVAVSESSLLVVPEAVRSKAVVIPNAVDPAHLSPTRTRSEVRASWGVAEDAFVVGYLGRLSGEKNPRAMVELARVAGSEVTVVIVGSGVQEEEIRSLADGLVNVRLVGSDARAGDVLQAFDCLVVPSRFESFGLSIAEGVAVGVPVVSTDVGIAREVPGLTRISGGSGSEIWEAVKLDRDEGVGTLGRVGFGRSWVAASAGVKVFGKRWSDHLAGLVPVRSLPVVDPASQPCGGCGEKRGPLSIKRKLSN
jgi:hypothetical protein